jgi:hypothetical protein
MPVDFSPYIPLASTAISVLAAAAVAWYTVQRSFRTELSKLQLGVQQNLLEQLVASRLRVYPILYAVASDIIKAVSDGSVTKIMMVDMFKKVQEWDSQNALLLGADTTNVCFTFRQSLREYVDYISENGLVMTNELQAHVNRLFNISQKLELGLRSDIGIYGIGLAENISSLNIPNIDNY